MASSWRREHALSTIVTATRCFRDRLVQRPGKDRGRASASSRRVLRGSGNLPQATLRHPPSLSSCACGLGRAACVTRRPTKPSPGKQPLCYGLPPTRSSRDCADAPLTPVHCENPPRPGAPLQRSEPESGKLRGGSRSALECPPPGCVAAGRGCDVTARSPPKDPRVSPQEPGPAELSTLWCPLRRKPRVQMSAWGTGLRACLFSQEACFIVIHLSMQSFIQ